MGRIRLTILALPVSIEYNGSKLPPERRPPPELESDFVQLVRSREINRPALSMALRIVFQLVS
jgi:hypothetical protein